MSRYIIDYLYALDHYKARKAIAAGVKALSKLDFDAIAFSGTSGALIAPALAYEMEKGLIVVKKNRGHSFLWVEGHLKAAHYVIVDDFVSSGETIKRIAQKIRKDDYGKYAELVGVYEYATNLGRNRRLTTPKNLFRRDDWMKDITKDLFAKYGVK